MDKEPKIQDIESGPKKFDWRKYLRNPDSMPVPAAEKLDAIVEQLADVEDQEMLGISKELVEGIQSRNLREPVTALVGMFRSYLSSEDRAELNRAIEAAEDYNPVKFH